MITVIFAEDKDGNIIGYQAEGHAGYAPKGQDIVCAAVSAALQGAVLGVMDVAKVDAKLTNRDGDSALNVKHPTPLSNAILETARQTIRSIAAEYPDYVEVV